jgi:hypothetical protein
MSKITLALLLAGASAVAPPRIELDLSAANVAGVPVTSTADRVSAAKLTEHNHLGAAGSTSLTHTYTAGQVTGSEKVNTRSHQDWSQTCAAVPQITAVNCPAPSCQAYDHADKDLDCITNFYLIDFENSDEAPNGQKLPYHVSDWTGTDYPMYRAEYAKKRMTWLAKYDAKDTHGNHAEQVVFALIVNDVTAPSITNCYSTTADLDKEITLEAGAVVKNAADSDKYNKPSGFCETDARVPKPPAVGDKPEAILAENPALANEPNAASAGYQYTDDVDCATWVPADCEARLSIVYKLWGHTKNETRWSKTTQWRVQNSPLSELDQLKERMGVSTMPSGYPMKWIVEATVEDHANYYGTNGENNVAVNQVVVRIQDTQAPRLWNDEGEWGIAECCKDQDSETWELSAACKKAPANQQGFDEPVMKCTDANPIGGSYEISNVKVSGSQIIDEVRYESAAKKLANGKYTVDVRTTQEKILVRQFARDLAGNWAVETSQWNLNTDGTPKKFAERKVRVMDRLAPVVTLKGHGTVVLKSTKGNAADKDNYLSSVDGGVDSSFTVSDTCAQSSTIKNFCSMSWKGNEEPDYKVLKDYIREYECCDRDYTNLDKSLCNGADWTYETHGANCCMSDDSQPKAVPCCHKVERTFAMVDAEAPTLELLGEEIETVDASQTTEYTDAGATCKDFVDGVLSHAVEVSGEVVDMRKEGKYTIRYDCTDLTGHAAKFLERVVHVKDRTPPVISLLGAPRVYAEAGFPYDDAGFTVSDDLDGDGTTWQKQRWADKQAGCMTEGNVVTDSCRFPTYTSCGQIKAACPSCQSGNYCLKSATAELQVWCDMTPGAVMTILTPPADGHTVASIQSYHKAPAAHNSCDDIDGFAMASLSEINLENAKIRFPGLFFEHYACAESGSVEEQQSMCLSKHYLCSLKAETSTAADGSAIAPEAADLVAGAELGTFTIKYYCKDAAGNKDQAWQSLNPASRTVVVQDSIAPVVTLHMNDQMAASTGQVNDSLMAEATTTVNGWMMGALASAVTGLALLGFSLRKPTTVLTSVPV